MNNAQPTLQNRQFVIPQKTSISRKGYLRDVDKMYEIRSRSKTVKRHLLSSRKQSCAKMEPKRPNSIRRNIDALGKSFNTIDLVKNRISKQSFYR
jgi:hypothetical protein